MHVETDGREGVHDVSAMLSVSNQEKSVVSASFGLGGGCGEEEEGEEVVGDGGRAIGCGILLVCLADIS